MELKPDSLGDQSVAPAGTINQDDAVAALPTADGKDEFTTLLEPRIELDWAVSELKRNSSATARKSENWFADSTRSQVEQQKNGRPKTERKTKILFVNRSYWPDMEATGQLLTELCESLARGGSYDVSVLCGQPNRAAEDANFKTRGRQVRNGVTIRRVRHTQFDKSRFWFRATNFITFCISAFFALLFGPRPDVIICQTDPPLGPIAACLVAFIRRTKFVCYLQDVYPDIAVECGKLKEGFCVKVLRKFLVWCYCRADRIIMVSNDMRTWLGTHGVSADKVDVIQNWVDIDTVYPVKQNNEFRAEHLLEGKFVVMYSGNVGQTQRFDVLVELADRLKSNENIVFMIVGGGVKLHLLKDGVSKLNLENVRFAEYQPKNRLAVSLSAADIQLVLLNRRMTRLMMPSKLYSALASGTAILGIGDCNSHLAEIVIDNGCGWFFEAAQLDELVERIVQLANQPDQIAAAGNAGRELAIEQFDRAVSISQFEELLDSVSEFVKPARVLPITPTNPSVPAELDLDPSDNLEAPGIIVLND